MSHRPQVNQTITEAHVMVPRTTLEDIQEVRHPILHCPEEALDDNAFPHPKDLVQRFVNDQVGQTTNSRVVETSSYTNPPQEVETRGLSSVVRVVRTENTRSHPGPQEPRRSRSPGRPHHSRRSASPGTCSRPRRSRSRSPRGHYLSNKEKKQQYWKNKLRRLGYRR